VVTIPDAPIREEMTLLTANNIANLKGNSALKKVDYFIVSIDSCDEIRNFGEKSK